MLSATDHSSASSMLLQEFHAYITLGGKPPECDYPLKGIGFLPCGWGEGIATWLHVMHTHWRGRLTLLTPAAVWCGWHVS